MKGGLCKLALFASWDSWLIAVVVVWLIETAKIVNRGVIDRCCSQKEGGSFQKAEKARMILL